MLPDDDREFLDEKGFAWELVEDENGHGLILKGYEVGPDLEPSTVDLLIRIPRGYPIAALDMFWVEPALRLRASQAYPNRAERFEDHFGRKWQRFSRHLHQFWKPGVDGLRSYLALIGRELKGGAAP